MGSGRRSDFENRSKFRGIFLGDQLNGTAWISYKFIQWASCSARIEEINTDNMKGFDPLLDPLAVYDPTADPVNFGGEKNKPLFRP